VRLKPIFWGQKALFYAQFPMIAFFSAIVSVSFIILLGAIAARTISLEAKALSQLSVYILAPALVADGLYRTTLSFQSAISLLLSFALISVILYGIIWILGYYLKLPILTRKSLLATTLLPNNGNLGLPLIAFTLGDAGLERAIIYMIGSSILLFGIIPALLAGHSLSSGFRFTLKLPLVWAMLAGLGLRFFDLKLPFQLDTAIAQLGKAAIPIALLLLGVQLASTRFGVGRYESVASGLRLGVAPLVAYGVGKLFHLTGLDLQVLVLQSAMPVAVNTIVLVTEFGGDSVKVARTIVTTTLVSLLTIPFILWLSS
jgi:predicted permease